MQFQIRVIRRHRLHDLDRLGYVHFVVLKYQGLSIRRCVRTRVPFPMTRYWIVRSCAWSEFIIETMA
jgi:hypothetical protein